MKLTKLITLVATSLIIIAGCSQPKKEFAYKETNKTIDHIHGIGFLEDNLYIATHTGLMKHNGEKWYATSGNNHDYMGFSMVKDGFYSSGHPEQGSNLKNPLGLIKSTDNGKTLEKLAFYGESDFHYLAAGFESNAIYVINQTPNSELKTGMYYTLDEGNTWQASLFSGIQSDSIGTISAHPKRDEIIAVSTKDGLYLSKDNGNNFDLITDSTFMVPAVFLLEDSIIYSSLEDKGIHLYSQKINESVVTELPIPDIAENNPILFIAANHQNPDQIALVTYANDIYTTENNGESWVQIAKVGKIK